MSKPEPDPTLDGKLLRGGLKHNPFAALRPQSSISAESTPAPVLRDAAPDVRCPSISSERIVVRRERKGRGGKGVTIAEGAGLTANDLPEVAREAARALGTGARVEKGALVVQGEQSERLIAWLVSRGFKSVVRGN